MKDADCVRFLQWCLPILNKRWAGFRKVRRQVNKRISRRINELDLPDIQAYRDWLNNNPCEWEILDAMCRITISRFYRDRGVFDTLRDRILPFLAHRATKRGDRLIRCWSAGCASGEEPYTLKILWEEVHSYSFPDIQMEIVATDIDPVLLDRARSGKYPPGSMKELPNFLIETAFEVYRRENEECRRIKDTFRTNIAWRIQDIRREWPDNRFDLILCRNLVFTYFDGEMQRFIYSRLVERMMPGGVLVIGKHEKLPDQMNDLQTIDEHQGLYGNNASMS